MVVGGGRSHRPKFLSPAINAGNPGNQIPDFDQRGEGFPRQFGGGLDMGAHERQSPGGDVIFSDRFEDE